jgi:hypothetical protein
MAFAIVPITQTAAFALPTLERLLFRPKRVPAIRVLTLTPTRELAIQYVLLSPTCYFSYAYSMFFYEKNCWYCCFHLGNVLKFEKSTCAQAFVKRYD